MHDAEAAMVVEWPQERRHRLDHPVRVPQRLVDIPESLLRKVKKASAFSALVQTLVLAFNEKADPQEKLSELLAGINRPETFGDYDEIVRQVVLALACVETIRETPTREMWAYLWSMAWHSRSLETFLPQAVIAATTEVKFREQFYMVARSVVEIAAKNPGRRAIQREKEIGANLRDYWKKHPKLSALWSGNFKHNLYSVTPDDDHVLSIVAEIDMVEFVRLLTLYDYPDPVAHALIWWGRSGQFERWSALASVAPAAFGEHGEWKGSLILPLLLTIARDQFQFGLGRDPTPNQISEATNGIKSLSAEVAKTIMGREDSLGCMTRWGNWLVRTAISAVSSNPFPHPTDAASQGFIEDALLEALIAKMPVNHWNPKPTPDAEPWEPWCQLAVGALISLAEKTLMPSAEGFLEEWSLTPEDWPMKQGQKLKDHAFPFEGSTPRADGYGARILALPLVEFQSGDTIWKRFWDSTVTLREVVEFGDPDEINEGGWEGRTDAARLLMLQFSIGLMMMDHLIGPQRQLNYDRRTALESLLPLLDKSVREMTAIDQLNGKFWSEALRHLAIRRAKWLSSVTEPNSIVINAEVKPTLVDFIRFLAGDTENLLALTYVTQRNGLDRATLAAAFKAAQVDINAEITIAEHLLAISPRAIGLNKEQIDSAREVLNDTPPTDSSVSSS